MRDNPLFPLTYNYAASLGRLALIAVVLLAIVFKANVALAIAVLAIGLAYVCQYMDVLRQPEFNNDETVRDICTDWMPAVLVSVVALWLVSFICACFGF